LGGLIAIFAQADGGSLLAWGTAVLVGTLVVAVVVRYGVLATAVMVFIRALLLVPITSDPSAWFFENSVLVLLAVISLALYGLLTAGPPLSLSWGEDRLKVPPRTVP